MPSLYHDTGYEISHLMSEIEHGSLALPDIQRPFVWSNTKIRDLFDSLYKGFPVGTLMFWETGSTPQVRQIGESGNRTPSRLIIDGQQRLTSLWAVMKGVEVLDKKFAKRRVRLAFNPATEAFEVPDAAIKNDPMFLSDITPLWTGGYRQTTRKFLDRLRDVREFSNDELNAFEERLDRVRDLQRFRFQVIQLTDTADPTMVSEVFVRINSKGVSLQQTDFILTLMSVHWEEGRAALERFARSAVDPRAASPNAANPFINPNAGQMLRTAIGVAFKRGKLTSAYSILRGRDPDSGDYSVEQRDSNFAQLQAAQEQVINMQNWHDYLSALRWAGFWDSKLVSSETCVIYCYALWLIGRIDHGLPREALRTLIGRYFFMAQTTRRYTSSPESTFEGDLNRLKRAERTPQGFLTVIDGLIDANLTDDYFGSTMPTRLDSSSSRSPEFMAYRAALLVLDADVLLSTTRMRDRVDANTQGIRGLELHHLFPRAYLEAKGQDYKSINAVANKAVLEWPTNVEIGAKPPATYWPQVADAFGDQGRLARQCELHALAENWFDMDYQGFLADRRQRMAQVVRSAFAHLTQLARKEAPEPESNTRDTQDQFTETDSVECKSTFRVNLHTGEVDKRMEHAVAKTVAAFFNSGGGTLFIGVDDDGNILGLADDIATLGRRASLDGFELSLRETLQNYMSRPTVGLVKVNFPDNAGYCRVDVLPASQPVFCASANSTKDKHNFYVRDGNATRQLYGEHQMSYSQRHWN